MRNKRILVIAILLTAFLLARLPFAALAAPAAQVQTYATPTPGADGRIIYVVEEGDNCLRISLMTGVSMEYLRQTNHLDENCTILTGQQLIWTRTALSGAGRNWSSASADPQPPRRPPAHLPRRPPPAEARRRYVWLCIMTAMAMACVRRIRMRREITFQLELSRSSKAARSA